MNMFFFFFLIRFINSGSVWISSELKGLNDDCEHFEAFPPGHLYSSKNGGLRRWYNPPWFSEAIPSVPYDPLALRQAFESVRIRTSFSNTRFVLIVIVCVTRTRD